jgi:hypothetical protein
MPWWGWLLISLLGAALIIMLSWVVWFLSGLARSLRGL